jgi:putative transposase
VTFGLVQTEKAMYPVRMLCRTLLVSASGFYAWSRRGPSPRSQEDAALKVEIRAAHAASGRRYGSPRIHADLKADGQHVGRKRVARLMREEGLEGQRKRRFRVTTDSRHSYPVAANELNRNFTASAPNKVWVTDITYIWTREGWIYLAAILDLFSRRVVGWSADSYIDRTLALDALGMALQTRRPEAGLIHHSDRGVQYASGDYRSRLRERGIICSMSRKGDCWDNAVAESFFSTLKAELVYRNDYVSRSQARASIFEYIEAFYNGRRRHSTLGYVSPVEHESAAARDGYAAADSPRLQARRGAA